MEAHKKPNETYSFSMTEGEFREGSDSNNGACLLCGEEQFGGCEPDARRYRCDSCGECGVYGLEELLVMGKVSFVEECEESEGDC